MPRIKLIEQESYEFHYKAKLQPRDINYGGHLGNDSLVSLLGAARVNILYAMGMSEGQLGDGETGVIMSDLAVNFKAEAFMLEEVVIDTHIGEFSRTGFRIFHRLKKEAVLVAIAETGMITFNYSIRKIAPVPDIFLKTLEKWK
jgi:acyl-CoA thioester hydrolase